MVYEDVTPYIFNLNMTQGGGYARSNSQGREGETIPRFPSEK